MFTEIAVTDLGHEIGHRTSAFETSKGTLVD